MKSIHLYSTLSTYDGGQLPDVCRRNADSLIAAMEAALMVGQSHHGSDITQAHAMTLRRHDLPDQTSLLGTGSITKLARLVMDAMKQDKVWRVEVHFRKANGEVMRVKVGNVYAR